MTARAENGVAYPGRRKTVRAVRLAAGVLALAAALAGLVARAETFWNLEAVNSHGVSTWNGSYPVTLTGVLLTDSTEMLDSTADFLPWNNGAGAFQLGGQWQVFVQAVQPGDRGGGACWMAQNYGNLPWEPHDGSDSYTDAAWAAEVNRVSHDPATGRAFREGDLVTITANGSLFYGGMQNVNEEHNTDPAYDFTIALVATNYGLPAPEVISLSSVIGTNLSATGHYDIFDPARGTGGEHCQGLRVRLNGLTLVATDGWNTNSDWSARYCTATDGEGRQFPLIHPRYDLGPPPSGRFDATGVLLQESGSGTDGTFGYELFVQEITPSDAVVLHLAVEAGATVIAWPASLANYQLQASDSLPAASWTVVTNAPGLVDGKNTVTVELTGTRQFYRLLRVR